MSAKWLDAIGHILVLLSAAFQLFIVTPWTTRNEDAKHEQVMLAFARVEAKQEYEPHKLRQEKDALDVLLKTNAEVTRTSEMIRSSSLIAGMIFLFGSGFIVGGKLSSPKRY